MSNRYQSRCRQSIVIAITDYALSKVSYVTSMQCLVSCGKASHFPRRSAFKPGIRCLGERSERTIEGQTNNI
jgi:hypothetical protein